MPSCSKHPDSLLKIRLHFSGTQPSAISYLIYGSRTPTDKSSRMFPTLFIWRRLMAPYWFFNILKCRRWGWKAALFKIIFNCFKSHILIAVAVSFIAPKLPVMWSKASDVRFKNTSLFYNAKLWVADVWGPLNCNIIS